jgi:spermidine synthase
MPHTVILVCFFLSGATGLVYEVLWLRMLSLVFGHTVYAITTVLAAFMAGLALGSFLFARASVRIRNLIQAYGLIEIGIGIYCLLIPWLFQLAASVYLDLHRLLGFSYDTFSFLQFLLLFSLLLLPTTLMGGTLPVLSQALVKQEAGLGQQVGTLYAINTFGAVVGVILAGYALVSAFGTRTATFMAVMANLAVGTLAIAYSRKLHTLEQVTAETPQKAPLPAAFLTVATLAISGSVSMIYEVAWTRALALVIGSSTYAFTAMLVAFLVGIAGGSALYSWIWGKHRASIGVFALIQVGIGLAVMLTSLAFERIPELFLLALRWSDSPSFVQLTQFVVSASALLPSTLLIGATFPCAVAIVAGPSQVGRDVGQVYAANTVGAIIGTVGAGFMLVPSIGIQASLKVGIAVNVLTGALLLVAARRPIALWQWGAVGTALATVVGALIMPPWDQRVLSSGPAIYGKAYLGAAGSGSLIDLLRAQKLLFYKEGPSGTVSVNQEGRHLFLRTNGKLDAGTAVDMPTQLLSGHLPMLFHPDPKRVLVIGMGSGITAGAVARHPIERLDIAEIEPAVFEASRFFSAIHGGVLQDSRVRPVVADARNFLLTTDGRYDAIISEPSNPWVGGLASLFSTEFFWLARAHLEPGGIMLQWIQGYNLYQEDFRMVVNTFRSVFPSVNVWNTIRGDYLLIGRMEPAPIDLTLLKTRYQTNPGVWRDLDRLGVKSWAGVLGYFMLGEADAARLSQGAGLNTDDRLPLEFSAPRAMYLDTADSNWEMVRSFKVAEFPDVTPDSRPELDQVDTRYGIGVSYLRRTAWRDALHHFKQALRLDPGHRASLLGAGTAALRVNRPSEALEFANRILALEPRNANGYYLAGLAAEAMSQRQQASAFLGQAVALQPQNGEFQTALRRNLERDGRR